MVHVNESNKDIALSVEERLKLQPTTEDFSDKTRLYLRRWYILFIYATVSTLSAFNWIEYNIIQDVTIKFYNSSLPTSDVGKNDAVNWFSMVYMLCYLIFVFPAMFLLDKKGLKFSIVLGASLTTIGSVIKCLAVDPDLFLIAILGQTICAIAQAFTFSIPSRLSALWFGNNQIALATSIGVFGFQLGTALGFLIPPLVVVKSDIIEDMQLRFYYLLIPVAVLCALVTVCSIIFVEDQPPEPPSIAQLRIRMDAKLTAQSENDTDFQDFIKSLKKLFRNTTFLFVLVIYGMSMGSFYAISTLLNQIVSSYHQNENEKIGIIGLTLVVSGLLGSIFGGVILDKTKKFKLVTLGIYISSFMSMVLFTTTLSLNIWLTFATAFLLGFFMTGFMPVGFELVSEITYPEPEGTSCGLLNSSAEVFGILFTYFQGRFLTVYGALVGNIFICVCLLIGSIITCFIKFEFRRQTSGQTA